MEFLELIQSAGVAGAGGAGFPTHVKLKAKAEYFIVNGAECEPLIETDKYLCRTYPERIVETTAKIASHLGAAHGVIALKGEYKREIQALSQAIEKLNASVEIFQSEAFYPAGDEQVLVWNVTGRSIPEKGLPLDVGCVVDNVGTVLSIADALEGTPVCEKFLSVTGAVKETKMFHVPLGTLITDILKEAEIIPRDYAVILGGPMMGKMLRTQEEIQSAVVTKTTGNLLVLPKDHYLVRRSEKTVPQMIHIAKSACIQCRMCTDMCPRFLIGHEVRPNMVMRNLWRENLINSSEEAEKAFGSAVDCCSCGVCEMFACPMGLSPRKMNEYAKGILNKWEVKSERNMAPQARAGIEHKKIPTKRLIARLGLAPYVSQKLPVFQELDVNTCYLPLRQHIGKPAVPVVHPGQHVEKGELAAKAAEGLSLNIHTGMAGVVTEVTQEGIKICREEV